MSEAIILKSAQQWSGALRRTLMAKPEFGEQLLHYAKRPVDTEQIDQWLRELLNRYPDNDIASCKRILRLLRERVFYTLFIRDLQEAAPLHEVVSAMSYLADLAMAHAYATAMAYLAERHGPPRHPVTGTTQPLLILAMGKWGGYELNVSSDIDFIALYEHEGETDGRRKISYHEFYNRLVQHIHSILSDITEHGQVFRCDLRLRPDGDAGPLAWSFAAVENYLVLQGREWERYAWLKARPLSLAKLLPHTPNIAYLNDKGSHETFEQLRTPFVYRKYFDFDALAALRNLRERIRDDWQQKAFARNATDTRLNIKLGDGGIREIEFVVQLNQLIRGGRLPSLQQENLLLAIDAQSQAGVLDPNVATKLKSAYRFLRRTEHLLQYKEDTQTHLLPADERDRDALANALGLTLQTFDESLQQHRSFVHDSFKNAFRIAGLGEEQPPTNTEPLASTTTHAPEHDDEFQRYATEQFDLLLTSHRLRHLPRQSRERLERLLPLMANEAAQCDDAEETLRRLLNVVENISQRSAYVALLAEYPETLKRLTTIVAASPWVAQYLARYPLVLDSLIEWQSLMQELDFDAIKEQLSRELDACQLPNGAPDVEQQMNLMRNVQHQITFQLIAQDLSGLHSVEELADSLSALADLMLEETIRRTWPLAQPKGHDSQKALPPPRFAVIAYGKLGGKELGYASDLDLVFLYDDSNNDAVEQYVRLGRRMISWLSTLTSSGRLYEVDMRLRPDGDAGLIAVSIDGFEQYQSSKAWSWEHQAITRARFVAGDVSIGARFEELRRTLLLRPRDPEQLRQDIRLMRERISAGHPNHSDLFDLKHDQGGMVDIEFITQFLVLAHAHTHPILLNNLGNIALLGLAANAKLIDVSLSEQVVAAYRHYRKRQHSLRLQAQTWARVPPEQHEADRNAVRQLWEVVIGS